MQLERLYKTVKSGAIQVFDIVVTDDTFTVSWGQLNGKMQTKTTTCTGCNIGRSNETSPSQQAIIEAKAVWVKKQKTNYSTSTLAPTTSNLPMKVNDYHKFKHKIVFPCYASPKLNGVNAEYRLVNGELTLLSRGGEQYPIPQHQVPYILAAMKAFNTTSLNGEMYKHGEFLQDIMAATKKTNPLSDDLIFMLFDLPLVSTTYEEKVDALESIVFPYMVPIDIVEIASHEALATYHKMCVAKGLEGIIVRNKTAMYEYNTRSLDVFKYKAAQDAEFEVEGFTIDKNGHAVFKCITKDNKNFKVKLRGTNEERLEMSANASSYIGKFLKVEFEELSKDLVPLKPVGICFRKVDVNGEAIE